MVRSPIWIAQREGQDWEDPDVLAAIGWLTQFVSSDEWGSRIAKVREIFDGAVNRWAVGERIALYDPADLIAWYVFQANAYAAERRNWVAHEAYRIAPVFRRLGQILPALRAVGGVDDRVRRLMTESRRSPDDCIYELLVAGAYKIGGYRDVSFVPESPGRSRSHDFNVNNGKIGWAVECKRVGRSGYAADERASGESMARLVHEECERRNASLIVDVNFSAELVNAGDCYLSGRVADFLSGGSASWSDEFGAGRISLIDWHPMRQVLGFDDIYFGSSRMIELLAGEYRHDVDYSTAGDWVPADGRPFHAAEINRASVVKWVSASDAAAMRKARHFRSMVGDACGQLPGDRPGIVHVGYETVGGNAADRLRHERNRTEIESFTPGNSRLEWVYGNFMTPENCVDRNESSALSETTATYMVGRPTRADPLPGHMLFSDEIGEPGHHWSR